MSVKFVEYWNLRPLLEEKYAKYLIRKWIPGMNELGITILAVWNVLVGAGPQFISEGIAGELSQIEKALRDERHAELNDGLFQYVEQYFSRVMVPTGLVPILIGEPKHQAIKLNQLWDPLPAQKEAFSAFLTKEFVPALEEMGLIIGGHWRTLVGPIPHQILEGRCGTLEEASAILDDHAFHHLRGRLQDYVTHYESRILKLKVVRSTGPRAVAYDYL